MVAATTLSAGQRRNDSGGGVTPQLSCELCRERKVKCDKLEPCTTCVLSGVDCLPIYRQRLPRGRHSQHKTANVERRNHHAQPNRTTSPAPQPKSTPLLRDAFLTTDDADVTALGASVAPQAPRADLDTRGTTRPTATPRTHSSASLHQEVRGQRDSPLLHLQRAETCFRRLFNTPKRSSQLCGLLRRLLRLPMAWKTEWRPHSMAICFGQTHTKRSVDRSGRPSKSVHMILTDCSTRLT